MRYLIEAGGERRHVKIKATKGRITEQDLSKLKSLVKQYGLECTVDEKKEEFIAYCDDDVQTEINLVEILSINFLN